MNKLTRAEVEMQQEREAFEKAQKEARLERQKADE